jgi:adenosylcobinamide-GDP ribazoletransferase
MSFFRPVIALLQFTTIIPLGRTEPFESFAQNNWLYPLAGYVIGGITGLILFILPSPPLVSAAIGIGLVFLFSGCNHLDGLMDLGDGLMAHGSREVRIRALTDRSIGTGGIALGMVITLLAFGSLASTPAPWCAVIIAEVGGKYAMALMTIFGRPFHEGLHAALHGKTRPWFIFPASLLLVPLCILPVSPVLLLLSGLVMVLVPGCLILLSKRLFGGVNGDVTGSSGEIARALTLAVISSASGLFPGAGFFS